MKNIAATTIACCLLGACASTTPSPKNGEKVADSGGYAPTGTFIKRKDGTGLGGTLIGTVSKQEAENARAMFSSGQGARGF